MLISVFSPKGGVGTTVSAVLLAQCFAQHGPTLIIDTSGGDVEAVVGADGHPQYSFIDWFRSAEPTPVSLCKIAIPVIDNLDFVTGAQRSQAGATFIPSRCEADYARRQIIVDALVRSESHCVLDLGKADTSFASDVIEASDLVVMVLRECYLGLSCAVAHPLVNSADVGIVVQESGRSISSSKIAQTLSFDTVIEIDARRDFARCIDAGVLVHRTPPKLISPIAAFVADFMTGTKDSSSVGDVFEDSHVRNNQAFWADEAFDKKLILNPSYLRHAREQLKEK